MPDVVIIDEIESLFGQKFEEDTNDNEETHTHIISPPENLHIWQPGMTSKEIVDIARMNGLQVVALCGKVWVPKKNPDKYPACPKCMQMAAYFISNEG